VIKLFKKIIGLNVLKAMESTEKVAMLVLRAFGIRKKQTNDMQVSVTSTDFSISVYDGNWESN
jgi:hypothetical protein